MNIFEKLGLLFKTTINKWFTKTVDFIHENAHFIHTASDIVANVNNFVQGSTADILTSLIPGTLDDTVKTLAREWLPKLIVQLHTAENYAGLTNDEILAKFVAALPGLTDEERTFVLHNLASLLSVKISGGALKLPDVYATIQGMYESIVKPKLVAA
jgi:hypothetical protein